MAMKKLWFVIIILLLTSCAHRQKTNYVIPQDILSRSVPIYYKVVGCLNISEPTKLFIHPDKKPNAWIDLKNNVYLTEGLFRYDDEMITFVLAHELSHAKLKHVRNQRNVSLATTGVMMVAGFIIPGAGLLNYAVNPAVTNNFNKFQEADADRLASESLVKCFDISVDQQVQLLQSMQYDVPPGGGFWDRHPSWSDRIENIKQLPR